jgi:hypothetical protein
MNPGLETLEHICIGSNESIGFISMKPGLRTLEHICTGSNESIGSISMKPGLETLEQICMSSLQPEHKDKGEQNSSFSYLFAAQSLHP